MPGPSPEEGGRKRRRAAGRRRGMWTVPVLLAALLAGCARRDLDLGRGGLSAEDDARLSLALAQVRAQAPADRISGLYYEARAEPEGLPEPELALSGEGVSLGRGFQAGEATRMRLALYLDKSSYTRGYATVGRDGAADEVWRIVAYELRGQADRDFEFTYLLADPRGVLRTLMLIGGTYRQGAADRLAIEGVLFLPDPGPHAKAYTPEEWKTAYPFPFVAGDPVPPRYQALTAEAGELERQLGRQADDLDRLAGRIDALDAEIAKAGEKAEGADGRRAGLEQQLRARAAEAQAAAAHCFELRAQADSAFAAYLRTNAYAWRDGDGRQEAFAQWDELNRQAGPLEERIARVLPYAPRPQAIEEARAAALAAVARNKNASHRPAPAKE